MKCENKCYSCIGHLRYSTSGSSIKTGIVKQLEIQPIRGYDDEVGSFYLAHNGNIPNIYKSRYYIFERFNNELYRRHF